MWDLSFLTRNRTGITCVARQILNPWTTREVPRVTLNRRLSIVFLEEVAFVNRHRRGGSKPEDKWGVFQQHPKASTQGAASALAVPGARSHVPSLLARKAQRNQDLGLRRTTQSVWQTDSVWVGGTETFWEAVVTQMSSGGERWEGSTQVRRGWQQRTLYIYTASWSMGCGVWERGKEGSRVTLVW